METLAVGGMVVRVRFDLYILHERAVIAAADQSVGDHPEYWQELGIIFTGKGLGDVNGVRFFDLNGDVSNNSPASLACLRLYMILLLFSLVLVLCFSYPDD